MLAAYPSAIMSDEAWPRSSYVPDADEIAREERAVIEAFEQDIAPTYPPVVLSGELVGSYPDTAIRMSFTKGSQTQVQDFSLWDGQMIGAPRRRNWG
jgi:hypothetical protein